MYPVLEGERIIDEAKLHPISFDGYMTDIYVKYHIAWTE